MYKINEKYPSYKIYDNGIITDLNNKPLKMFTSGRGYLYVNFYQRRRKTPGFSHGECQVNKKTKIVFIHRLVAYMFCKGYKEGLQVNHINGIKTDNRACNLEWVTAKENMQHSVSTLRNFIGSKNPIAKKIDVYNYKTGTLVAHYDCIATMIRDFLCKNLGVNYHSAEQSVYRILKGVRKSYYGYTFKYV